MSKIRDLKTNPENCFNVVEAIELFTPQGKSKYVDMLLRIMNNTPNLKEHGSDIISHMIKTFDFIDKDDLKKFNPIQLLLMYKFTDTYFNTDDLLNFRKFCDYNERNLIDQNDLSTYKSFEEVITQVNVAEIKVEMKELESEVVRVHEDDEWLLVRPTTFLASKKYGANTKWCTTSESNPEYFLKYAERGVLIYCMNKKTGYKVASFYSLKASDPEFSFWNQKDTKIESMDSELSDSMLRIIRDVSKDPSAVSNRRLLETEQLEKENKSLRKWMSIDSINHIVREFSMDSKPKMKENRLSRRIQDALRREEIEDEIGEDEMPVAMNDPQPMEEAISYDMDGGEESEGPYQDIPEITRPMPFKSLGIFIYMEIIYTARFLKDYNDIKEKRGKKDTDKVISLIETAPNFIELNKMLDIKKLNAGIGGYRIRYSNKPEYRIRINLIDSKIELLLVLPREKYEKYAHRTLNESVKFKPMKFIVTESQLKYLMEDYYNPDKLYSRDYIIDRLKKAPRYIKKIGDTLDYIKMVHKVTGEVKYFTTISEQLYNYLFGNF